MQGGKNTDLQCLRAIAIILVMMQHYRLRLPTPAAYSRLFDYFSFWTGVDIFFAISGLLICHSFVRDLRDAPSWRDAATSFWIRRLGRLFPALLFWVVISIVVAAIAEHSPGADVRTVATSGAAAILGVSNAFWSYCVQRAVACGHSDFNGVTWSLSLEWQLYATLTLLIVAFGARTAVLLMLLAAMVMSAFPAPSFSFPWAFRLQAFALGAATFLILGRRGNLPTLSLHPLIRAALLIAGIFICISAPVQFRQPFILPTVAVGALLCLLSSLSDTGYSSRSRFSVPLVWIGERSYSVYLCHLPIILITKEILARSIGLQVDFAHVATGIAIAGVLIAVCSDLSYRFIEKPFQEIARRRLAELKSKKTNSASQPIET
jgi:peptidoglycan/LPS O-acetylase OafA/YrhL